MSDPESVGDFREPTPESSGRPADVSPRDPAFLRARSRVYALLAAALDGDVDTLEEAIADGTFDRLSALVPDEADVDLEPLLEETYDADALSIGYDNLFVVPGPHYVPPFASAHATDPSEEFESDSRYHDAGEAGELLGDPAAAMARRYERVGFTPAHGDGIPDHVAAILEFLAVLADAEARHRARGDAETAAALCDLQRETLVDLGWLDAFHAAVAERDAREGVFAALVALVRTVAAWDVRVGVG